MRPENVAVTAGESVWAIGSVLPRGLQECPNIMVLQAYIDDSGSEPTQQHFVLAGFAASPEAWSVFANEWDAALKLPPSLDYFKAKEAYRLQDQFSRRRGWTETLRDERIALFDEITARHAVLRISSSMKNDDFHLAPIHRTSISHCGSGG
jgi:hypothetical protein